MEFFYRCTECGEEYEISPEIMLCPGCAGAAGADQPLSGILEVGFTGGIRSGTLDIPALMPVPPEAFPPMPVGNTPLWEPTRLREKWDRPNLYLKDDTANPTGSLKDRASQLVAAFACANGLKRIVVASTGNAACSMAGVGAAAGLDVRIFVPRSAPRAKLVQALQYGATVTPVDGSYDDACAASISFVQEHGGYSRNTGYNPLTIEGKKTVALEIYNQLGRVPDVVFVPTGDGVILCGVYKGFLDLQQIGLSEHIPKLIAVQAQGSSAIARAHRDGAFGPPVPSTTRADSIAVSVPAAGRLAVRHLAEHAGECVLVTDDQITAAQRELSALTGLFAEPAAAAAYAGYASVSRVIPRESTVVLLITGTGLKDIDGALAGVEVPW